MSASTVFSHIVGVPPQCESTPTEVDPDVGGYPDFGISPDIGVSPGHHCLTLNLCFLVGGGGGGVHVGTACVLSPPCVVSVLAYDRLVAGSWGPPWAVPGAHCADSVVLVRRSMN